MKLFQVPLEHYSEKIEGEIPLARRQGQPNRRAHSTRANLPPAMQGFVVVPLFAGYDERRAHGRDSSATTPTGGKLK